MGDIAYVGIVGENRRHGNNLSTFTIPVSDLRVSLEEIFDIIQVHLFFTIDA